jgi:hypothetical protein
MRVRNILILGGILCCSLAAGCKEKGCESDSSPEPVAEAAAVPGGEVRDGQSKDVQTTRADIRPFGSPGEAPAPKEVEAPAPAPEPAAVKTAPAPIRRRPTPPKVGHLITVADLVGVLIEQGWMSEGPIPGISPDGEYASILYTRPDSTHMVSVRLWEYGQHREAVERWNALLAMHPNSETNEAMTKETFFWTRGSVAGLVFLEADRSRVIGVSCHTELCDDNQLLQLAAIAHGRAR